MTTTDLTQPVELTPVMDETGTLLSLDRITLATNPEWGVEANVRRPRRRGPAGQ